MVFLVLHFIYVSKDHPSSIIGFAEHLQDFVVRLLCYLCCFLLRIPGHPAGHSEVVLLFPITSGHLNRGIRPPLFSGCEA
jgi:hypothetical protein